MSDRDGLYLNGVWVATADNISETHQGNDLTKPATIQTSYSNSFTIPDSLTVRKLLANAEQLDSASRLPYQALKAEVIRGGEITFSGLAQLSSFSAGWEIELFEEKKDLFTRLDRSIKTANLSQYDHDWTVESINSLASKTDGVFYPLVDYGLLKDNVFPLDTIFPAVFAKSIVAQMLYEEGYVLTGDILGDELYKRLFLPFSESDPTNYDEQWQIDRYARVTQQRPNDEVDRGTLGRSNWLDRIQPFNLDNIPETGFKQGILNPYSTTSFAYVCPDAMNVEVKSFQVIKALCLAGAVEVILSVLNNGQEVDQTRFEAGAGYNLLFLRTDRITLSSTIKCKKGDRIQIRLQARRQTKFGAFRILIYNDPDNSYAEFNPKLTTALGDTWKVSRNLPELTGKALLIAIAYALCGTWLVDNKRRQMSFAYFKKVIDRVDDAIDWSYKINTAEEIKWSPRIDPYGQSNSLKWKETDETKKAASLKGTQLVNYGDGIINVDAPVLENQVDLFEMPFGASTDSTQSISGYGSPPLIKTRTVTGRGDTLQINSQDTQPRLLLASLDEPFPVQSSQLKADGITVEPLTMHLRPCWFGKRPEVITGANTMYTLSFGPLGISNGEVCLIDRYYEGVARVLRRMRLVTVRMHLYPVNVAEIDFERPIRLQRVAVGGSLVLSDGFYYLNKVADYQADGLCNVTLIAF